MTAITYHNQPDQVHLNYAWCPSVATLLRAIPNVTVTDTHAVVPIGIMREVARKLRGFGHTFSRAAE